MAAVTRGLSVEGELTGTVSGRDKAYRVLPMQAGRAYRFWCGKRSFTSALRRHLTSFMRVDLPFHQRSTIVQSKAYEEFAHHFLQMVERLHIAKDPSQVGYYAGAFLGKCCSKMQDTHVFLLRRQALSRASLVSRNA